MADDDNTPMGQALAGLATATALMMSFGCTFEALSRTCLEAAEAFAALHQELKAQHDDPEVGNAQGAN